MALTVEVEKSIVAEIMPKAWSISLLIILREGTAIVVEEKVSEPYKIGYNIPDIGARLKVKAQAIIDKYKSEQLIYNNPTLDTVIATIQFELEV